MALLPNNGDCDATNLQPYPILEAAVMYPDTPANKPAFVPVEWTPLYSGIAGKHLNRTPAVGGGFVSGMGCAAMACCLVLLLSWDAEAKIHHLV